MRRVAIPGLVVALAVAAALAALAAPAGCGGQAPRPAAPPRAAPGPATTATFDDQPTDAPPSGFALRSHGPGRAARWVVVRDDGASPPGNVLAQTDDDPTNHRYNLALLDGEMPADVRVAARAQAVAGGRDRSFGVVARWRDGDSYYLARCNTSGWGSNVRLYRFEGGVRTELASAEVEADPGTWYDLALEADGDRLRAIFAGQQVLEVVDARLVGGGRCGVWTKAESVSRFDDLVVTALAP